MSSRICVIASELSAIAFAFLLIASPCAAISLRISVSSYVTAEITLSALMLIFSPAVNLFCFSVTFLSIRSMLSFIEEIAAVFAAAVAAVSSASFETLAISAVFFEISAVFFAIASAFAVISAVFLAIASEFFEISSVFFEISAVFFEISAVFFEIASALSAIAPAFFTISAEFLSVAVFTLSISSRISVSLYIAAEIVLSAEMLIFSPALYAAPFSSRAITFPNSSKLTTCPGCPVNLSCLPSSSASIRAIIWSTTEGTGG